MARFDVYRLFAGDYVLDCQADLHASLSTRLVVPLVPIEHVVTRMARLNPQFEIEGAELVMMTQLAGAVPARALGKPVLSLDKSHDAIAAAIDMLLMGY